MKIPSPLWGEGDFHMKRRKEYAAWTQKEIDENKETQAKKKKKKKQA
jgi:heme/copper-type cytochrome/quinol oxidase subunit 2